MLMVHAVILPGEGMLFLFYSSSIPTLFLFYPLAGRVLVPQLSVAKRISLLTWIRDLDPAPGLPTERLLLRALFSSFKRSQI